MMSTRGLHLFPGFCGPRKHEGMFRITWEKSQVTCMRIYLQFDLTVDSFTFFQSFCNTRLALFFLGGPLLMFGTYVRPKAYLCPTPRSCSAVPVLGRTRGR